MTGFAGDITGTSPISGLAKGLGSEIVMPSKETRTLIGDVLEASSIGGSIGAIIGSKMGNPVSGGLTGIVLGSGIKVAEKIMDQHNKKIMEQSVVDAPTEGRGASSNVDTSNLISTGSSNADTSNSSPLLRDEFYTPSPNEFSFFDSLLKWFNDHLMSSNEGNLILCIFILSIISLYIILLLLINIVVHNNREKLPSYANNRVFKIICYLFLVRNNYLIFYYLLFLFIIIFFNSYFLYILLNYSLIIK